jgi:hypothetical protein
MLSFMNPKTWLLFLSFFSLVINGCGALPLVATEFRPASVQSNLPEFIDDPAPQTKMDLATHARDR